MSTDERFAAWPGWSATPPFLLLAFPVTFLLYRGGRYCGPLCFEPTPIGMGTVAVSLLALSVLAVAVACGLRAMKWRDDRADLRGLATPPRPAGIVLLGLFLAFVGFLTLDALSLYEAVWKPIVLPASFVLFLPVWVFYTATFPLAVLFSIAGIEPSPVVTLVTRGVVLFVGFPLSAVLQTLVASAVVGERRSGSE